MEIVLKVICENDWNYSLVQILIVVANIQVETLKAEGEKGLISTSFGYQLIGPKE